MNNILLICSHLGARFEKLAETLNKNSRVEVWNTGIVYNHIDSLNLLASQHHKLNNSAAVYGDCVLYNYAFGCKKLYELCKFIYVIEDAKPALNRIVTNNYSPSAAESYYRFRLRRLCEMAKSTPGAVLLRTSQLTSTGGLKLIEDYLRLKEPLISTDFEEEKIENKLDYKVYEKTQEAFERYYFYLKSLNLSLL